MPDAGSFDAGTADAGAFDAGTLDAGTPLADSRFAVAALAGISLDLARPAAQVTALIDWSFLPAWGLALDGSLDSQRTLLTSRGTITLQHYAVGLSLRRHLFFNLHATAGGRLVFLPASVGDTSRLLISGAFFLTVDWRQPLIGPLFLIARIGTQARIQPEVLVVSGAPEFMVLPVWSFVAQAGLGLKL